MSTFDRSTRGKRLANLPDRPSAAAGLQPPGSAADQPAFEAFCQTFAPKLWGIILLANLPVVTSEDILVNTLVAAWQQRATQPLTGDYVLSGLIRLAHQQGLPYERVQALLSSRLKLFSRASKGS
ncbi:hypothetical protein A6C57_27560 (plasmid) [Fibrella sp. ES10-3-2-2]